MELDWSDFLSFDEPSQDLELKFCCWFYYFLLLSCCWGASFSAFFFSLNFVEEKKRNSRDFVFYTCSYSLYFAHIFKGFCSNRFFSDLSPLIVFFFCFGLSLKVPFEKGWGFVLVWLISFINSVLIKCSDLEWILWSKRNRILG